MHLTQIEAREYGVMQSTDGMDCESALAGYTLLVGSKTIVEIHTRDQPMHKWLKIAKDCHHGGPRTGSGEAMDAGMGEGMGADTSAEVYEMVETGDSRVMNGSGTIYFPSNLGGPDLLFILKPPKEKTMLPPILCILQVRLHKLYAVIICLKLLPQLKTGPLTTRDDMRDAMLSTAPYFLHRTRDCGVPKPKFDCNKVSEILKTWGNLCILRILVACANSDEALEAIQETESGLWEPLDPDREEWRVMMGENIAKLLFGDWFCRLLWDVKGADEKKAERREQAADENAKKRKRLLESMRGMMMARKTGIKTRDPKVCRLGISSQSNGIYRRRRIYKESQSNQKAHSDVQAARTNSQWLPFILQRITTTCRDLITSQSPGLRKRFSMSLVNAKIQTKQHKREPTCENDPTTALITA
jgi:hypothetical protein